ANPPASESPELALGGEPVFHVVPVGSAPREEPFVGPAGDGPGRGRRSDAGLAGLLDERPILLAEEDVDVLVPLHRHRGLLNRPSPEPSDPGLLRGLGRRSERSSGIVPFDPLTY